MDDDALQQELEALAGNAFNPDAQDNSAPPEPMHATIARWTSLFGLSADEAVDRIAEHRNNLTRPRVSDAHWDMLRDEKEVEGYDREAYEYELDVQKRKAAVPDLVPAGQEGRDGGITFLVEMKGPLHSVEKVQIAAGMDELPIIVRGKSTEDGRPVSLCCVDGLGKAAVLRWASAQGVGFEPTILVDPRSLR